MKLINYVNKILSFEEWQLTLQQKYSSLHDVVQKYIPEVWLGLEFELSVLRILNLYDNTLPFIGLILGRPGSGKTVIVSLLRKWYYTYFKDSFTPKAWQSHSTAVKSKEELEQIDMLPQIRGKLFLTAELSPMLTKKEDELAEIIGTIVRLADGQGLSTHSGAHGGRQEGNTMFTWVGAAVDIPNKVYRMLSTLGPKWYHFRLPFKEKTESDLMREAISDVKFSIKEQEIEKVLFDYLKWFEIAPNAILPPSDDVIANTTTPSKKAIIEWDESRNVKEAHEYIVKLTLLLSHLRCAVQTWEDYESHEDLNYQASICEDPSRTRYVLYNLARGHALLTGRNYITIEDIPVVVKTVLSTAQIDRVSVFSLLISMKDAKLTTAQIMRFLNKTKHPALKTMTEFKAIGLVDMYDVEVETQAHKQSGQEYSIKTSTKQIALKDEFKWFLTEEFDQLKQGFVTTDNREYLREDIEAEGKDNITSVTTHAENRGGTHNITIFWSVFDEVERQELEDSSNHMTIDKNTVSHDKLYQALVSSGHFYNGDAEDMIKEMIKAGKLEKVMLGTYRRNTNTK